MTLTAIEIARENSKKNRKKLSNVKYYNLHHEEILLKGRARCAESFEARIERASFILDLCNIEKLKSVIMDLAYKNPNLILKTLLENIKT